LDFEVVQPRPGSMRGFCGHDIQSND
jgi:hypothetical protein